MQIMQKFVGDPPVFRRKKDLIDHCDDCSCGGLLVGEECGGRILVV